MFSQNARNLAKEFEGLRLVAYCDPAGVWTIGYGHTKDVKPGQTCTVEDAEAWLNEDLTVADVAVDRQVHVPLTQNQYDALVDFVFNLGEGRFQGSTLLAKLNDGDYQGAQEQFIRWVYVDGRPSPGLMRRREAEATLFGEGTQ